MTTSIYRRVLAAGLLAALVVPFQNCGEKADLGTYVNNSSTSAPTPGIPEIVDSTPDSTVAFFESTAVGVVAYGEGPLTYEWKKDGVVIPGQFKSILAIAEPVAASPTVSTTYVYTVTVKDKDGELATKDIRLTVARSVAQQSPPTISAAGLVDATAIPACVNGTNHANRALRATATGTKVRVTWTHHYVTGGGQNIADATGVGADGAAHANYIRYFNNGLQFAKCISEGRYVATATDYFGQTATAEFTLNY